LLVHEYYRGEGSTDFRYINSDKRIVSLTIHYGNNGHGMSGFIATLEDGSKSDLLGKKGYASPQEKIIEMK